MFLNHAEVNMQWRIAAVEQLEPQGSRKSFVGLFIERRPSGSLRV